MKKGKMCQKNENTFRWSWWKYIKIRINWDYDLPLEKTLKACRVVELMRSIINDGNKYYTQILLDEYLYLTCVKIAMQT